MAITALEVIKDGMKIRTKVFTVQETDKLAVDLYYCNEEWIPKGTPHLSVDKRTEEEFHRELRSQSKAKGHFVPTESTNPEWNPD